VPASRRQTVKTFLVKLGIYNLTMEFPLYIKKWHEFKNYLSTLDDLPAVLCIQESHLTPKYQPSIPQYHIIRKSGGLMIYVKTSLEFIKLMQLFLPASISKSKEMLYTFFPYSTSITAPPTP